MRLSPFARGSGGPKLTAAARCLKGQLGAHGVKVVLSEACLTDLVLNATEAVAQTLEQDDSYIVCPCRQLDARARSILLWTTSDEPYDGVVWRALAATAQKHALPRVRQLPQA